MNKNKKIGFKDLSKLLKTTIILFWIEIAISVLSFIIGFLVGFFGV